NPPVSLCGAGLAPRSSRAPLRVLRPAHSAVPAVPRVRLEWRRGLTWADAGVPRRLLSACQQSRGRRAWPRAPGEGSRRGLRGYRPARRSRPIPAAERGVPGTFRASWELFVQHLAACSYRRGSGRERKALTYTDLSKTAEESETFQFLADILPKKILASKYLKMLKEKRDEDEEENDSGDGNDGDEAES
uniref:Chromatin accessibility complex protein 1 n=1 Tax=Neovison vison TaxID=452646 RepID=A0A8C7BB18_NEOVI